MITIDRYEESGRKEDLVMALRGLAAGVADISGKLDGLDPADKKGVSEQFNSLADRITAVQQSVTDQNKTIEANRDLYDQAHDKLLQRIDSEVERQNKLVEEKMLAAAREYVNSEAERIRRQLEEKIERKLRVDIEQLGEIQIILEGATQVHLKGATLDVNRENHG